MKDLPPNQCETMQPYGCGVCKAPKRAGLRSRGIVFEIRVMPTRQHHESGLKNVVLVRPRSQHAPANAQHQSAVAAH